MPNPLVLLIEDDCRLCGTISDLLELLEIDYRVARNDTISHASLVALKPDLVLLDMPLRGRGCLDTIADIRSDFRLRHTKLVVIGADEYAKAPEYRLADLVLMKPFAVGELEYVLRHVLGHQRAPELMLPNPNIAHHATSAPR
jgi:DNA-binding response OmpR family regulator